LEVTELPIGVWTQKYKEMLESWIVGEVASEKKKKGKGKKSAAEVDPDQEKKRATPNPGIKAN
jgi:hypothetical protein